MNTDEHHVEAAEACVALEQGRAIARVRNALDGLGRADCADCGEAIEAARRNALPSARRCIACQTHFERRGPRGY